MLPYTGDYIEHIDDNIDDFKYYTFTPRPLMHGDMYKMDDELSALLIEAHRNIGFLEGLLKYAPNKDTFSELMQLKECAYSLMIDYDSPTFQDILVNLNILKSQEEEKRKKLQELAKSEKPQPENLSPTNTKQQSQKIPTNDFDVRQVASSYHNINTTKYKGAKTIAPLDDFTIEKRFGPYYDPVYKMKVFNESITLVPKGDDKVKSVLDGKVVFAKDTPILKRVVIIEHKNNIHTIYAQLDKIAPTIKPGSTVKKGYTIGRVENVLKFEVTLKDKHIDPLELITSQNI